MKVLLSAYSCGPNEGSEAGLSWNWAMQMARFHEVWVITRSNRRRKAIEAYCAEHDLPNVHFVFCDLPKKYLFWKRGEWGTNIYYLIWQMIAFERAKKLVAEEGIELAHHVSFMSLARGSFVPFLGVPSVIGPVGGLQTIPASLNPLIRKRTREKIRNAVVESLRYNPVVRACLKKADVIILANAYGAERLEPLVGGKLIVGLQIGSPTKEAKPLPQSSDEATKPVTFHWSGRFVDHKGFELLILALAKLVELYPVSPDDFSIVVSGKGEEEDYYRERIEALGLDDYFNFEGWLAYDAMEKVWDHSDAFIMTSLRETTGMALQEAMMRGVAPIVVVNGGPGEMVTPEVGLRVEVGPMDKMVTDLAHALHTFITDDDLRLEMSKKVRQRALSHYSWTAVGDQMNEVYNDLVKVRTPVSLEEVAQN